MRKSFLSCARKKLHALTWNRVIVFQVNHLECPLKCSTPFFGRVIAQSKSLSWFEGSKERMGQSISIFGLGYVGSVTAACLAHKGNRVIGVDTNVAKVEMLESGRSPILEAGIDGLVADCRGACRLHATTDVTAAVRQSDISFICVGTPSLRNGKLDLGGIRRVSRDIGEALRKKNSFHVVVPRSTMLPGSAESIVVPELEAASRKRAGVDFAVCVNPEFMREGTAVEDFFHPPFTILGASDPSHLNSLRELYQWAPGKTFETSWATAEMIKYACNAYHALKVSFANEMGTLCKHLGVDTQETMGIFASETRLNVSPAYLKPGFAFGGSCLPKDLRALIYRAKELDLPLPLLESILPSNSEHVERAVQAVLQTNKKKVGVLGLSFKAGTDDLRESPLVHLVKRLLGEGCQIQIWDENVALGQLVGSNRQFIEEVIPHIGTLLRPTLEEVVKAAEVLLVGTGAVRKEMLEPHLRSCQTVIDLTNLKKGRRPDSKGSYEGICW